MERNSSKRILLPKIAIVISVIFIAFGTWITISASFVHDQIEGSTALIEKIEAIEDMVTELEVAGRMELATGLGDWELKRVSLRDALIDLEFEGAFEQCAEFSSRAIAHLEQLDKAHVKLLTEGSKSELADVKAQSRRNSIGLTRQIDRMNFTMRNQHLNAGLDKLATRWGYFQFLFLLACSLALLLAFLAVRQKELVEIADERADQLKGTTKELESTNIELRETLMSKEEKEMMLKEIHHRVKNNLQIIRSLIRFQAMKVSDPQIEELFNECVNRVSAMAVLHEQTYLSKDLANIDVKDYLNMLVKDLTSAYNINMHLDVQTDIQVETLGVDTLMPIGLLINEIISNSLKYAFQDRSNGTIKVSMVPDSEGKLQLTILDDGVGIPDLKVWNDAETLGMELIKTLVDQLSGTVQLNSSSGTSFEISFPVAA